MSASSGIQMLEVPIGGNDGRLWKRLHEEREDVCEALTIGCQTMYREEVAAGKRSDEVINRHRALLQHRLRQIDDALDQLMVRSH